MIELVCILGLGWISCNMGVLGAMFPAFFESDFESECDSESECESCSGDMKVTVINSSIHFGATCSVIIEFT